MTQYIYFVKCPGCDDEPFDFFDEAKAFAMNCLTKKPIITQVECDYNDCGFGERTNTNDLGTVWSWEETMGDMPVDDGLTTFSKSETFDCDDDSFDCEFDDTTALDDIPDNFRKPVFEGITDNTRAPLDSEFVIVSKHPNRNSYSFLGNNFRMTKQLDKAMPYSTKEEAEHDITYAEDISMEAGAKYDRYTSNQFFVTTAGEAKQLLDDMHWKNPEQLSIAGMTIEALVEEMEENEDTVECKVCEELFDKTTCRKDPKLGWVCEGCSTIALTEAKKSDMDHFGTYYMELNDDYNMLLEYRNLPFEWEDEEVHDGISMYEPNVVVYSSKEVLPYYYFKISIKDLLTWLRDVAHEPEAANLDEESLLGVDFDKDNYDFFEALLKKHKEALFNYYYEWAVEQLSEGLATGDKHVLEQVESYMQDQYDYDESVDLHSKGNKADTTKTLTESSNDKDSIELHYDSITTEIVTGTIPATLEDPEESIEGEWEGEFDFEVDTNSVKEVLWSDCLTEEDVASVPGGFDTLEDDVAFEAYMDEHFDELVEKYYDKLLDLFKADAEEVAKERFQAEYDDLMAAGPYDD